MDYVYSLDHIVKPGETESISDMQVFPGGKGLNQSIAISRAGGLVFHAGCLGNDSDMLYNILKDSGVDLTYINKVDIKNGHAVIQVSKDGENSIFLYPGSNVMLSKEYINDILSKFKKDDIVLLQNETNNVEYIINEANKRGMTVVFNPSPITEDVLKIDYNKLSYLLVNEGEAKEISGKTSCDDSLEYFKNKYPDLKVVLTLGKKGCKFLDNGKIIEQTAYKVTAVDTTAAGDTFTGYFISGICNGIEYKKALEMASAASAISVSRNGAAPSIPNYDEVVKFIKEY